MAAIPTEPETAMSTATNRQFRLASRPRGAATRENFSFHAEPVAQPAEDGVLVKNLMLSLDPAMRGWMNEGRSYIPPVGIGEVMRAGGVGRVVRRGTRPSPSATWSMARWACRTTRWCPATRSSAAAS